MRAVLLGAGCSLILLRLSRAFPLPHVPHPISPELATDPLPCLSLRRCRYLVGGALSYADLALWMQILELSEHDNMPSWAEIW